MVTQFDSLEVLLKFLQEFVRKMMSYSFADYLVTLEIFEQLAKKNALDLTAPASDALLKNRKNAWVQLAGHPGAFAPAGPHTIWKKRLAKENTETRVYQQLQRDNLHILAPKFYREVEYNQDFFIEMEDLLQHFQDPHVMDVKMGTRTFLESEVKNPSLRKDLYDKMIKLDPNEPTAEEHQEQAITKLRYMQFREQGSSTSTLGFRIEAIRASGEVPVTADLKKLQQRAEVQAQLAKFIHFNPIVRNKLVTRLKEIRHRFESSHFFETHEIIGSSLLFLYDNENKAGVWMIDFAKTLPHPDVCLTHRSAWQLGNHEDGYLSGLDNIIQMFEDIACLNDSDSPAPMNSLAHTTSSTMPTSFTHSQTVNHPSHAVNHPSHAVNHPSHPVNHPSHPVNHPAYPVSHSQHSVSHPSHTVNHPSYSVSHPSHPVSHPSHPVNYVSHPVNHPSHPQTNPLDSRTQNS